MKLSDISKWGIAFRYLDDLVPCLLVVMAPHFERGFPVKGFIWCYEPHDDVKVGYLRVAVSKAQNTGRDVPVECVCSFESLECRPVGDVANYDKQRTDRL